jgi:hypothetical protein
MASWCKVGALAAAMACLLSAAGEARTDRVRRAAPDGPYVGWVRAESDWGNQTISAPVRRGRLGYEVRLPGGNWVDCRRDCAETLRVETIDFWQSRGPEGLPGHRLLGLKWKFYY